MSGHIHTTYSIEVYLKINLFEEILPPVLKQAKIMTISELLPRRVKQTSLATIFFPDKMGIDVFMETAWLTSVIALLKHSLFKSVHPSYMLLSGSKKRLLHHFQPNIEREQQ